MISSLKWFYCLIKGHDLNMRDKIYEQNWFYGYLEDSYFDKQRAKYCCRRCKNFYKDNR